MAKAKYFSECGGLTVGAQSRKIVRYPAGIFEAEKGDLTHCAEVEDFDPAKNGVHFQAAEKAGLLPASEDEEAPAYPTASMKAARPIRTRKK